MDDFDPTAEQQSAAVDADSMEQEKSTNSTDTDSENAEKATDIDQMDASDREKFIQDKKTEVGSGITYNYYINAPGAQSIVAAMHGGGIHNQSNGRHGTIESRYSFEGQLIKEVQFLPEAIVLACLTMVPISDFYGITKELRTLLLHSEAQDGNDQEDHANVPYSHLEKKLQLKLSATKRDTYAGSVEVQFVRYSDDTMSDAVLHQIWTQMPYLRDNICTWLNDLVRTKRNPVYSNAVFAFGKLISLDFDYALNNIISEFERYSLPRSALIPATALIMASSCSDSSVIDNLMKHWCSLHHSRLWMIAAQAACGGYKGQYSEALVKRIKRETREMLRQGVQLEAIDFLGQCIHEDSEICMAVLETLSAMFLEAAIPSEREQVCNRYLSLLFFEYANENSDLYELKMLGYREVFKDADGFKQMIHYIMTRSYLYKFLFHTLGDYLMEINQRDLSWEYMKPFLRCIAFGGGELSYRIVTGMLARLEKRAPRIPRQIHGWLNQLVAKYNQQ